MQVMQELIAPGKGILAADQGAERLASRMEALKQPTTDTAYREYCEMLFRTPMLNDYVSGIIMAEEAALLSSLDGTSLIGIILANKMTPGISPSTGVTPLSGAPGEYISQGLDGLRERLIKYRNTGFHFSKWRSAIRIGADIPSAYCIKANAHVLAQFAAISQEVGLVPIVEPEVELCGDHTIEKCFEVTEWFLHETFYTLYHHHVKFDQMLLKTNMVVPGEDCPTRPDVNTVAEMTLQCLRHTVPLAVPGITFLSGGQSDIDATAHLDAMNKRGPHAWVLSFSYARALQRAPLKAWGGQADLVASGQAALYHRAKMNGLAARGQWSPEMEQSVNYEN